MVSSRGLAALAGAGAALAAWGLFEAQWVQERELEIGVPRLPPALDGLTILHLSDFHAGTPSLNLRAMRKAVAFGARVRPDLVALTGDILSTAGRGTRSSAPWRRSIRRSASSRCSETTTSATRTTRSRAGS